MRSIDAAALDPTLGSEIQKDATLRRVVVLPPEMNDHLRVVVLAPMATGSRPAPLAHRLRVSAQERLGSARPTSHAGQATPGHAVRRHQAATLAAVLAALQAMFAS
jgi:mRNA interferase MazF